MTPATPSTSPASGASWAGAPPSPWTRALRRPCAGTSRARPGGRRCASPGPARDWAWPSPGPDVRALLFGPSGQLGRELLDCAARHGVTLLPVDRAMADLTDAEAVAA